MLDRLTVERMAGADAPLLLALSGGGDSTALLHLLADEVGAGRLRAAIVDHALRAGSAADAAIAAASAETRGVAADVLRVDWQGDPRRAQEAAREARLHLLCEAARRCGARFIVMAHTADDQAETVIMRAASGSGWRGLAAMAAIAHAPLWPHGRGLAIARPLLGVRRGALRAYLGGAGRSWIDDPANADAAFARVRARACLAQLATAGLDPLRLAQLAGRLRTHAEALDRAASGLAAAAARIDRDVHIEAVSWRAGAEEVRARALAVLLAAAGGAAREVSPMEAAAFERRMLAPDFRGGSLGGAAIAPRAGGWRVRRDPGAVLGRADGAPALAALPLPQGGEAIWDGRLALRAAAPNLAAVPADNADLVAIRNGERLLRLAEAESEGLVSVQALLAERVRHILVAAG